MTTVKIPGLPDYTPKRLICVSSISPEAYYEAKREMARDHVMYLRNRTTDPWDDLKDIRPFEPELRTHYADLILHERELFIAQTEFEDTKHWFHETQIFRFWSSDVQQRWEGWLCARLGFLPRSASL